MSHNRNLTANSVRLNLAAAIVIYDDCVLIVRRSKKEKFMPREWGVPCGKVDARGERTREAVLRELYEETRLTGEIAKYVGQQEFESTWHGRSARNVQYNYLISLKVDKRTPRFNRMPRVKTPKRDQEAKWIPLDKIDQQGLDRHNREAIRQGLEAYASGPDKSSEAMVSSFRR